MHWYPHNPQLRRYTTLDIADTHYNCHHTPHTCQTLTSLHECSIKTNIRHVTLELLLCILCLLCIFGLRSVMPLINEDWLIDWLSECRTYWKSFSSVTCDCVSSTVRFLLCIWTMIIDCGRMEEIVGSVVAEVDVPTASRRVLASLDVIGTVGCAKLHVPKSKPVLMSSCCRCYVWFCVGNAAFSPASVSEKRPWRWWKMFLWSTSLPWTKLKNTEIFIRSIIWKLLLGGVHLQHVCTT